jgi:hypothetical protein
MEILTAIRPDLFLSIHLVDRVDSPIPVGRPRCNNIKPLRTTNGAHVESSTFSRISMTPSLTQLIELASFEPENPSF